MCGIFGAVGNFGGLDTLSKGIKSLEYRGYDSSGIAFGNGFSIQNSKGQSIGSHSEIITLKRTKEDGGFPSEESLREATRKEDPDIQIQCDYGIAHTRWATHGSVTIENAHPHESADGNIHIVHNGVIENISEIKEYLKQYEITSFASETDSELIAHLLQVAYKNGANNLTDAMKITTPLLQGTYGIVAIHRDEPNTIVAARLGSPLVIGVKKDAHFIASDTTPIIRHTKEIIRLSDGDIATITSKSHTLHSGNTAIIRPIETIDWTTEQAQKDGYRHFMLKEIHEIPKVIGDVVRGRISDDNTDVILGGLIDITEQLRDINRIIITGCGTAFYAGMLGAHYIEEFAGIPVDVRLASELQYSNSPIDKHTAVIAVSQSGETADTLGAIREAKRRGALVLGAVNVVGSTIAHETNAGVYIHAGPEIAVASTKAFFAQVTTLLLYAIYLGKMRGVSHTLVHETLKSLKDDIPQVIETILAPQSVEKIQKLSQKYAKSSNMLFLGRGVSYPVACKGALKLKEVSYLHAEGCAAGEMKHGPLAMIDTLFPTLVVAPTNRLTTKTVTAIREISARSGSVIGIFTEGSQHTELVDDTIEVSKVPELLSPFVTTVVLHLFAYYCGTTLGLDVDLAKSVTTE